MHCWRWCQKMIHGHRNLRMGGNNHFRSLGFLKVHMTWDIHMINIENPPHNLAVIAGFGLNMSILEALWFGGCLLLGERSINTWEDQNPGTFNVWQVGFTSSQLGVGVIMVIMEKKPTWPILIWWADFKQLRITKEMVVWGYTTIVPYCTSILVKYNPMLRLCLPFS